MKTIVIIPAYNEEKRIVSVLQELLQADFEVIVVDDASTDDTASIVKRFPVKLARHAVNLGQGAALKTGTELAARLGYEIIAHFDADGQMRVEDVQRLITELNDDNVDIAFGSRFLEIKTDMPLKKKIILNLAKLFSRKLLKLHFTDPQIGLRAFKTRILDKLDWQKNDFQHATEILGLIMKNNLRYKEVPVKINYDNYSANKKVKPRMSMGWRMLITKLFE